MPRAVPDSPLGHNGPDTSYQGATTPIDVPAGDPSALVDDLARGIAGDASASDRVLRALYIRVRARVRRRLRGYPSSVVADAVQEAIARLVAYLPRCRATSDRQLVRWAMLVGWHAALRYVRSPAAGMAIGWDGVPLDDFVGVKDAAVAGVNGAAWGDDLIETVPDKVAPGTPASDRSGPTGSSISGLWLRIVCPDPDVGLASPAAQSGAPQPVVDCDAVIALTRASDGVGDAGREDAVWAGDVPAPIDLLWALLAVAAADEDREHRRLVWERAALGRSYADLAAAHGISPGAAKQRYQRTVARLRRSVATHAARLPEPLRRLVL